MAAVTLGRFAHRTIHLGFLGPWPFRCENPVHEGWIVLDFGGERGAYGTNLRRSTDRRETQDNQRNIPNNNSANARPILHRVGAVYESLPGGRSQ
jgi:hypothetical protein